MPTNIHVPTPTAVPTAPAAPTAPPPPDIDTIVALAQDFYDDRFFGTYVLLDATDSQIQSQDDTQLTACIAYEFASVSSPGTVAGTDTRAFTLAPEADGIWQVVEMGDPASCSLS